MNRNKFDCFGLATLLVLTTALLTVPSFAQESLLRILSPASGLVVRPGQTVTISVSANSSVQKLVLTGQNPLGMAHPVSGGAAGLVAQGQGEGHPLQFSLTIPTVIQPGTYHVTAVGRTAGDTVESNTLALDVERPDAPTRIWAEPSVIQFTRVGDQIPLRVLGTFPDGSQLELTRSSRTTFVSSDPRIASITATGMVTAVKEGRTSILVRTPSADYSIPVRVQESH
jgi:Bacterial Ig-like domain (group 2)